MEISARVVNKWREHKVLLSTNGREQSLQVAPKEQGFGSSVNGGELLFLALATCYCNDLYSEAMYLASNLADIYADRAQAIVGQFSKPNRPLIYVRLTYLRFNLVRNGERLHIAFVKVERGVQFCLL